MKPLEAFETFVYESRPLILIGIALVGFSHFGWNVGTFSSVLLITAAVMIREWRSKYRAAPARVRAQRAASASTVQPRRTHHG